MQTNASVRTTTLYISIVVFLSAIGTNIESWAQDPQIEFFESKIRPVLIEHCYECHNSLDASEGELAVDWKNGIQSESSQGTAVVPFQPEMSLLLKVIKHEVDGLEMPQSGPKLSPETIADFEKWIAQGAVDPREKTPTKDQFAAETSWDAIMERRKQWWSFQPIRAPRTPDETAWSNHPVDCFVARKLEANGLAPGETADRATLLRRLYYVLTGMPPTLEQVNQFVNDHQPGAFERQVDLLLQSKQFGEHWARHWMDLVRYADSHGSEGDPLIPNIYRYRDYLIRAFNADVHYDQLLREHLAGDLLDSPRINEDLGINESTMGIAHLRMVFHGFAPTDALDEKIRFTDDQINVFGKTFQGLTISCARCHDHKFDPISQADYYALFGVLGSCRPAMKDANLSSVGASLREQMTKLKSKLRPLLAEQWLQNAAAVNARLRNLSVPPDFTSNNPPTGSMVLWPWWFVRNKMDQGVEFETAFGQFMKQWNNVQSKSSDTKAKELVRWNLGNESDYKKWFSSGNGLSGKPSLAGEFAVSSNDDGVVSAIYPAGAYTNALSNSFPGVLGSPRFNLDGEYQVWFRLMGGGNSTARFVVQNYPRSGTVYPINPIKSDQWYWHTYDLSYWNGDQVHLELATAKDAPLQVSNIDRSWFGVREVVVKEKGNAAPPSGRFESIVFLVNELRSSDIKSLEDLSDGYQRAIHAAAMQWKADECSDSAALFLNACVKSDLVENQGLNIPSARQIVTQFRELESRIPSPTRVPGVSEADPYDHPLLVRGDHKQPAHSVPRRYLESLDSRPFETQNSGRLALANALLDENNPLTARVMVNRIWHHLFGRGIVATPDNFGKLGDQPTHPELLDYLATRFRENGWSIKDTIRFVLLSKTWQQSSAVSEKARIADAQNKFLSHANTRRLSAEAIRDSLVFASGDLDPTMYGPAVGANSNTRRRSVYIQSRRNSLDAFLSAFDSPVPFSTTGRRNETNVPAQSLAMLNDPFVLELSKALGRRIEQDANLKTDESRIKKLFSQVLAREPSIEESSWLKSFVLETRKSIEAQDHQRLSISQQLKSKEDEISSILDPIRQSLLTEKRIKNNTTTGPTPLFHWDFTKSLKDTKRNLDARVVGDAARSDEGLVLTGKGFAMTEPLKTPVREKTLEAWVALSDLDQRGGGVITHQDLAGNVFDSIVFGEQEPRRWLAGSNFFQRTKRFEGPPETKNQTQLVHFAITYATDGEIRGYRNGQPYGNSYRKSNPVHFAANQSQIVFGLRHGTKYSAGRMLQAVISQARFYDRALSAEEIAASASGNPYVNREEILASLSGQDLKRLQQLERQQQELANRKALLEPPVESYEVWARAAHALFNLKEFIYIR